MSGDGYIYAQGGSIGADLGTWTVVTEAQVNEAQVNETESSQVNETGLAQANVTSENNMTNSTDSEEEGISQNVNCVLERFQFLF